MHVIVIVYQDAFFLAVGVVVGGAIISTRRPITS